MKQLLSLLLILASIDSNALDCSKIEDSLKRLACFDQMTNNSNNSVNKDIGEFSNAAKDAMKFHFKDPGSVVFDGLEIKESQDGVLTLCGHVNGKNSYGGYVGLKPFYYNNERWDIFPEENKTRFRHYWQKYCQKALFDTTWSLETEGGSPMLVSENGDGVKVWLSCEDQKNTIMNAIWPDVQSKEKSFKGMFKSGDTVIIKIAPESGNYAGTRWSMKADGKTTMWKIPRRHYDFLSHVLRGIHFSLMPEGRGPTKFYLDGDFQVKWMKYKRLCPNKRFR